MATSNAAALSEILGIPSSLPSSPSLPATPTSPSPRPAPAPAPGAGAGAADADNRDAVGRQLLPREARCQGGRAATAPELRAPRKRRGRGRATRKARARCGAQVPRGGRASAQGHWSVIHIRHDVWVRPGRDGYVRGAALRRRCRRCGRRRGAREELKETCEGGAPAGTGRTKAEARRAEEAAAAAAEQPADEPPVDAAKQNKCRACEEAEAHVEDIPAPVPLDTADDSENNAPEKKRKKRDKERKYKKASKIEGSGYQL
ncbi:hypothetical protein BC834DRAFT_381814 [Gloeopeniophorella convolvens]|nr:hypothetical protein BC834DRAFT_381814 [Gloeopeniophorella convolvens]